MHKELYEFMVWLVERSKRDSEDIHERQFSTHQCKSIYSALLNGLCRDTINDMLIESQEEL